MKRIVAIVVLLLVSSFCHAQEYSLPAKTFSIGIVAGEYGYDSGLGLELTTPCVRKSSLCFRVKGTVSWLEHYKATFDRWARYNSLNISMVYSIFKIERSRGYVETGPYFIFPDSKFSARKSVQGFSGALGVELFVVTNPNFHMAYYFSGGVGWIKAYADKLENNPRYGNGFVFNNGFRFYF